MDDQVILKLLKSIDSRLDYIGTKINDHTGNLDKKLDELIGLLLEMIDKKG